MNTTYFVPSPQKLNVIYDKEAEEVNEIPTDTNPKLWISMALCWSKNTKYHGKSKYPYSDAAIYSSKLWMQFTNASLIFQIIYSEDEISPELESYREELTNLGVHVKLVNSGNFDCVLKAQLIRLMAFDLDMIQRHDLIMMSDVDAFITSNEVLEPLINYPEKQIWIYRYELTEAKGYTFMLQFISAKASAWRRLMSIAGVVKDVEEIFEDFREIFKLVSDKSYIWDVDQKIVSRNILEKELCNLPKNNKLWENLNLNPRYRKFFKVHLVLIYCTCKNSFFFFRTVDDSNSCYHGRVAFEDCNSAMWYRNTLIRYMGGNCKWWHFYPYETKVDMERKYEEIASGQSENGMFSKILKSVRQIQKDNLGNIYI